MIQVDFGPHIFLKRVNEENPPEIAIEDAESRHHGVALSPPQSCPMPPHLEDHPRTCKWLKTMVIVSPLNGVIPLINGRFMACK